MTRPRKLSFAVAATLAATIAAPPLLAQEAPRHLALSGIQSGLTAQRGTGFLAFSFTDQRAPNVDDEDGSLVMGLGFGDANKTVGVQVAAHVTSLKDSFGDSGYLSLRFSKRLSAGPRPVYGSLQFGQLANWGDANGRDETASFAITRFTEVSFGGARPHPVMMTIGAGTHVRDFETKAGVFGGVGIGLTENIATSIAWTGDVLTVGADFRIPGYDDVLFGISIDDVTDRKDNRRIILSVGYKFDNLFGG
jgi:hypothetical protein